MCVCVHNWVLSIVGHGSCSKDLPDIPAEVSNACLAKADKNAHAFAQKLLAAEKREAAAAKKEKQTRAKAAKQQTAEGQKEAAEAEEKPKKIKQSAPKRKSEGPTEYIQRKNSFLGKRPGCSKQNKCLHKSHK